MEEKKKITTFKEALEYGDAWQRAYFGLLGQYYELQAVAPDLRSSEKLVE